MKSLFTMILICIYSDAVMIRDNTVSDEEFVYDTTTNLIWQDDNDARERTKTWIDSVNYCEALDKSGYTDWRLPNINELNTLVDDTRSDPAISSSIVQYISSTYWSSTTSSKDKDYAWQIDFTTGKEDYTPKTSLLNLRCVKTR